MAKPQPLELVNLQAEKAVVGALLIDPDAILRVSDWLAADHFHSEQNRYIYEAVYALHEQQAGIDYMTVCAAIEQAGRLHEVGGAAYLTELIEKTPTSYNVGDYGRTVYRLGVLRKLVRVAGLIAQTAYQAGGSDLDDVVEKVRQLVDGVTPMAGDDSLLLWLESLEQFVVHQLDRSQEQVALEQGKSASRIDFPWKAMQRFSGLALRPGTVAIVAGGSGIGKTTFMECCAEHWARQGLRVAFFHLELSHQFMLDRRMVRLSGVSLDDLESGVLPEAVQNATAQMRRYPGAVHYVHCPGWSARRVANKARQMHARGLVDVIVVDYLQKLALDYRQGQNKADALGDCVEVFKVLTEQLGIPLLLGSQFNRGSEWASRKTGAYIRGSGEPHEKANIVITLDREIVEDDVTDDSGNVVAMRGQRSPQLIVRVDKNTAGEIGDCELHMNGARYLILDTWREKARAA